MTTPRPKYYWLKVYFILAIFWNFARFWWSNYENMYAFAGVLIFSCALMGIKMREFYLAEEAKRKERSNGR
jgi:hypothetical protein